MAPSPKGAPSAARDLLLLLALATIWSSSFTVIKIGVETIPPLTLTAMRISLAALILYGFARARGIRIAADRRFLVLAFVVGMFGNTLPFALINWGERTVDSGLAAILMAVMPLATLLLTHVFSKDERLTANKLGGIVVGFCGVALLVGPDALAGLGIDAVSQIAIACGALCYAVASTVATHMPAMHPAARGAPVLAMAAAQAIPLALLFEAPWTLTPSPASLGAGLYLGLLPTALATFIYFHLIAARGATFIALNNYMIPALGVLWGWLFLDEVVSARALAALAMILAGLALANWRARGRRGKA